MTPSADQPKYWAFISYSHADSKWGKWLHKQLETFPVPRALVGKKTERGYDVPKRLMPIFRDREELPGSSTLKDNIQEALEQSRYLVVICSPRSAASIWVNEEVLTFKAMGRSDRVLCLIVDGEPNATDKPGSGLLECFPPAVRHAVNPDRSLSQQREEPIAADARPGKDGKVDSLLKLASGLLGVGFDDLKQRDARRRRRRKALYAMAAMAFAALLAWGTWEFRAQRERLQNAAASMADFREADKQFQDNQGSDELGLVHLAKALKKDPGNTSAASRLFSELSDKHWVLPDSPLATGKGVPSSVAFNKSGRIAAMAFNANPEKPDTATSLTLVNLESRFVKREIPFELGEVTRLEFLGDEFLLIRFRGSQKSGTFGFAIFSIADEEVVCESPQHQSPINSIALSEGGELIAVAGGVLGSKEWDDNSMTFYELPNESTFAAVDGWLKVFRFDGNDLELRFERQFDVPILAVSFGYRDRILGVAGGSVPSELNDPISDKPHEAFDTRGCFWLFDAVSGNPLAEPLHQNGYVTSCDISKDGTRVATGSALGVARVWKLTDTNSPELVAMVRDEEVAEVGVTFLGDGTSLLTWGNSGNVRQWTTFDGAPETVVLEHGTFFSRAKASENYLCRVTWAGVIPIYRGGKLRIFGPEGSLPMVQPLRWAQDSIVDVWLSENSDRLRVFRTSLFNDRWTINEVPLVPRRALADQFLLNRGTDFITENSPDGRWILAVDNDTRTLRVFDTISREFRGEAKLDQRADALVIGKSGNAIIRLVMQDGSHKIAFYSLNPLVCLSESVLLEIAVEGVTVGEGQADTLAAVYGQLRSSSQKSDDNRPFLVCVFNIDDAKPILKLELHSKVTSVSLSPDKDMIAASCEDNSDNNKSTVTVWRLSGEKLAELPHKSTAEVVGFSNDCRRLATFDLNAYLWEVPSFRLAADLLGHSRAVTVASFSNNGRELATASLDGSVQRWDVLTGTALGEKIKGDGPAQQVLYNYTGDRLLVNWNASSMYNVMSCKVFETQTGLQVSSEKFTMFGAAGAVFIPDGRSIGLLTGQWSHSNTGSGESSISAAFLEYWDVAFGTSLVPEWLSELAESLTSYRIGANGAITDRVSERDEEDKVQSVTNIRHALLSNSEEGSHSAFGEWFLSVGMDRRISPYARTTIRQHRKRLIEEFGQQRHLVEAHQLDPSDLPTWAKLANSTGSEPIAQKWWELIMRREPQDPKVWDLRADYFFGKGDLKGAEQCLRKSLAKKEKTLGLEALDTLETMDNLGFVLGRMGQEAAAEEFLRRALIGRQNVLGDEHPDTQNSRLKLGELLSSREDFVGAEPLVAMWITVHRKNVTSPVELADAMAWLGWMRTKLKRYAEAEAVLRDCLATREKHMPNDWRIFNAKSMLGEALLGQKQPEDAKPFLLSGYEGLKEREGKIPAESKSNLTEAVLRIVNLYKSKSEHAEATKWKRELKRWTDQENHVAGQSP